MSEVNLSFIKFFVTFRLNKPEDVQYFQFDEVGNMFVFEPGAGCTGVPRLVKPGEELIFSSGESNWDFTQSVDNVPSNDMEFNDVPSSGRTYNSPLKEEDLEDLAHKNFSPETRRFAGSLKCIESGEVTEIQHMVCIKLVVIWITNLLFHQIHSFLGYVDLSLK